MSKIEYAQQRLLSLKEEKANILRRIIILKDRRILALQRMLELNGIGG